MATRLERSRTGPGLEFLDGLKGADPDRAHVALTRFAARLGFDVTESWLIALSGRSGEERLKERRTVIPQAETGILYLLDRGDPAFAWAAMQGRPWLLHPSYNAPLPEDSEAAEAIRASDQIVPSRMSFAIAAQGDIRLTSVSSDMPLRDLEAAKRRHAFSFAMACYAVAALSERAAPHSDEDSTLSPRERECLTLLASGLRNTAIAHRLSVAESTVEMHLQNARRKLGARTREQALVAALSRGEISI